MKRVISQPPGATRGQRTARRLGVLFLGVVLGGCGSPEESVFSEVVSPDGAWTLRITVAPPRMPQGPFHVGAYLLDAAGARPLKVVDTRLENDGVPFTARHIAARWVSSRDALLCLRATDLPDRGIRIAVGPPASAVDVARC